MATANTDKLLEALNSVQEVEVFGRGLKLSTADSAEWVYVWETWDGEGFRWVSGTWREWDNDDHACV